MNTHNSRHGVEICWLTFLIQVSLIHSEKEIDSYDFSCFFIEEKPADREIDESF